MSTTMPGLDEVLQALQKELPSPPKDKEAKIPTKGGGSYSYKYADLGTILHHIKPFLDKHKVYISHQISADSNNCYVMTQLKSSVTGEVILSSIPIPNDVGAQELGSWITYAKRYNICAILNIVAEEDDDAQVATYSAQPKAAPRAPIQPTTDNVSGSGSEGFVYPYKGRNQGKQLGHITTEDLEQSIEYWSKRAVEDGKPLTGKVKDLVNHMKTVVNSRKQSYFVQEVPPIGDEDLPF